jgi:Putative metal-binding motif
MIKANWLIFSFFAVLIVSFSLPACGDDSDNSDNAAGYIGSVTTTTDTGETVDLGDDDDNDDDDNNVDPQTLDLDNDGYTASVDCNDNDPAIHPGVSEIEYDGIDQDCDGADLVDIDGDGYAAIEADGDDCSDRDAAINPGASEITGNLFDEDCDGYANDTDGDGYDHDAAGGDDCNDADALINPGVTDTPGNEIDEDCDGFANDIDNDGHDSIDAGGDDCNDRNAAINPDVLEICGNDVDENCDGESCEFPTAIIYSYTFFPSLEEEVPVNTVITIERSLSNFNSGVTLIVRSDTGDVVPGREMRYNCEGSGPDDCAGIHFQPLNMLAPGTTYNIELHEGSTLYGSRFSTAELADPYLPIDDNRFSRTPTAFLVEVNEIVKPPNFHILGMDSFMVDLFNAQSSWIIGPAGFPSANDGYDGANLVLGGGEAYELDGSHAGLEYNHSATARAFFGDISIDHDGDTYLTASADSGEMPLYGTMVTANSIDVDGFLENGSEPSLVDGSFQATIENCADVCDTLSDQYVEFAAFCDPVNNFLYVCSVNDTLEIDFDFVGHYNPVPEVIISPPRFTTSPADGLVIDVIGANGEGSFINDSSITVIVHTAGIYDDIYSYNYDDVITFDLYNDSCPSGYCEITSAFFAMPDDYNGVFSTYGIINGLKYDVEVIFGLQYAYFRGVRF